MKKQYSAILALFMILLSITSSSAQKKVEGYDKIVFGSYVVADMNLREYVITKSGEVMFTSRMDKQYSHIGHLEKETLKQLMIYCNEKEWEDFMKFNPGKDYQFVRLYKDKQYIEMIWAPAEASAEMNELFNRLSHDVEGFPLPETVTAKK